jgi:hypothetical protein
LQHYRHYLRRTWPLRHNPGLHCSAAIAQCGKNAAVNLRETK